MDIGKLFELQKLDVNLEKARRKLAQLKQALGESEELGSARKSVADTEAELHRWHHARDPRTTRRVSSPNCPVQTRTLECFSTAFILFSRDTL